MTKTNKNTSLLPQRAVPPPNYSSRLTSCRPSPSPCPRLNGSLAPTLTKKGLPQSTQKVSQEFFECCLDLRKMDPSHPLKRPFQVPHSLSEQRTGIFLTKKLIETNPFSNLLVKNFLKSRHRETIFGLIQGPTPLKLDSHLGYPGSWYSLKELVGTGAFGHVFLAEQILTGQRVAVKAMTKEGLARYGFFRLENELKILRMFRWNPHIIHFVDYFETSTHVYLVFEYSEGGDLWKFFAADGDFQPFDKRVPKMFRQVVQAVADLHDQNVAHYDLKPDNILVDRQGNVKLSDFGISQILDGKQDGKKTGGTPIYSAPEMIVGALPKTTQSDIWSLGVLLYYLTFGKVPFEATSGDKVPIDKILELEYDFLETDGEYATVNDLIQQMLLLDPKDRPTARDILRHPFIAGVKLDKAPLAANKRHLKLAKNGFRLFLRTLRWMHGLEDFPDSIETDTHFEACVAILAKNASINQKGSG